MLGTTTLGSLSTPDIASTADRSRAMAAVIAGITIAAILAEGAFHTTYALFVGCASLVVVVLQLHLKLDSRTKWLIGSVGALTAWWLVLALVHGTATSFLPLGASPLAFLGAFLVIRQLTLADRETSARVLVLVGALGSSIGLAAVAFRWYPLAIQTFWWSASGVQHPSTWRLASTLTYYNAAGALFAIVLLIAFGLDQRSWLTRLELFLCAAAMMATQSRAALLALLIGAFLVPARQLWGVLPSLLVGVLSGVFVMSLSASSHFHLLVVIPIIVGGVLTVLISPSDGTSTLPARIWRVALRHTRNHTLGSRLRVLTASLLTVALVLVGVSLLIHPALNRFNGASNGDRVAIWASALDQWRTSPLSGVGPDHVLAVHYIAADGTEAIFAHNEYLQVLADGGVIGAALLVAVGVAVVRSVRRESLMASCACAALAAFAVAGAFDFDWHLPALGLVAGWVTALAGRTQA